MIKKTVGITGGIGAGKTFVSSILIKIGYPVFNSDQEAKKLVQNDFTLRKKIVDLLGDSAYEQNGNYNTKFVSDIVFQNPEILIQLNEIIHPVVRERFEEFVLKSDSQLVFNEAAILFETGAHKNFDSMILVTAPQEIRIQRCMERDHLSRDEIDAKMNRQWNDDQKRAFNPFIILNDGMKPLLSQIEELICELNIPKRKLETRKDIEYIWIRSIHAY